MVRVTITLTDVGEWSGVHERPSAAYARALVQAYPDPTIEPPELREQWLAAVAGWKRQPRCSRITCNNSAQSVWVAIEAA